jgi:hypothetical protein
MKRTLVRRQSVWRKIVIAALSLSFFALQGLTQQLVGTIAQVQRSFVDPPNDARPMMRWWWFGPAVVKPELEREILAMKAGGIGGFEIQPVYPLALDDRANRFRNYPYLSQEFLDSVRFAADKARANGMRVDITLASGWPYGGPQVSADQAASRLRMVVVDITSGSTSFAPPALENGEKLIAVFAGDGTSEHYDPSTLLLLSSAPESGRTALPVSSASRVALCFVASRTGQQVKRAALGAEGFVLDHFSTVAVDNFLHSVADRLMTAFGDTPPYAVFSDSLEVYGADWTDDLLAQFERRRGYDLKPYLPQLFVGTDPISGSLRRDWGLTLTELIDERYLRRVNDWAATHNTQFRSQTYGDPAVSLSSNRLVALPEGEGPQWNTFSYTRWATSASHIYGRAVTSAESWTWLHSPAFRATPLDMKAEADRFFLEGVNQLIGHGWPYTPPGVAEPGWAFYAAAVFNDHNPWWEVMPDVTKYLQRMSYLLRQGSSANDVAVLLPNDDVYAEFSPGKVSLSDGMKRYVTPALMQSILRAGYNIDYIDAEAIKEKGIHYPTLILPHVTRLSPDLLGALAAYVKQGGRIIAVGTTPSRAPGFLHDKEVTSEVLRLANALFADHSHTRVVAEDDGVGDAIRESLIPDMTLISGNDNIGFLHRSMEDADLYFVANTSNRPVETSAKFRTARSAAFSWDPLTGNEEQLPPGAVELNLAPYESRVIVFRDGPGYKARPKRQVLMVADISDGWTLRFEGGGNVEVSDARTSWTSDSVTRFYSGKAVYERTIEVDAANLAGGNRLSLDFGEGTPIEADPEIKNGMRALIEGPVRESGVVLVNGQRAGSVWHPPYRLDITTTLHLGLNKVEIRVANTAINVLAGRSQPDYRLLWARYGQRFIPQDMDNLKPLPSGLLGGVRLIVSQ